jgi:hypothetical protein
MVAVPQIAGRETKFFYSFIHFLKQRTLQPKVDLPMAEKGATTLFYKNKLVGSHGLQPA